MKSYRDEVCDRLADIFCELDLFYANVSGRYDLPELSRVEGAKDALIKLINDLDRAGIFADERHVWKACRCGRPILYGTGKVCHWCDAERRSKNRSLSMLTVLTEGKA